MTDTEIVLVSTFAKSDGGRVFHTDRDCRYVTERASEWRREVAECWGIEHCQACQGINWAETGQQDPSLSGGEP